MKSHIVDRKFLDNPTPFLVQSLLASGFIFLTLLVMGLISPVIVAAIGSSVFIVFAMPNASTAGVRSIFGGHTIGLLCGLVCTIPGVTIAGASFAVGLSIFFMVILDAEHPAAAGTALGVGLAGWSAPDAMFILVAAGLLSVAHIALRKRIVDLV